MTINKQTNQSIDYALKGHFRGALALTISTTKNQSYWSFSRRKEIQGH